LAGPLSLVSIVMVKIQCEREESWFISVAPTERFFLPTYVGDESACAWEKM
jgi:hypothetical protein